MATIQIPYNYTPRDYQLPFLQAMDNGCKRAFLIWNRRSGKDKTLVNFIAKKAFERVGIYYYFFPTYTLAKKVIWDGIDKNGFAFIDHFPKQIIKSTNSQEMKIELVNGSIMQLVGTDKFDSIRGTNPVGVVFSEFAFQNPMAWEVIRPILAENGGWAVFNTTPNGKNHAFDLYNIVKDNPDWFVQKLSVNETKSVPDSVIEEERQSGMSEEMIQQEYYVSFEAGAIGAYYNDEMQKAYLEHRIGKVPFYNDRDIDVFFDLGINDMMAMWFSQQAGQNINLVNYYEDNSKKLDYYFRYIRDYIESKKGKLGIVYVPHDASQRDLITGQSIVQEFKKEFGDGKVIQIPIASIRDGIQSVRKIFPRCYFDEESCKQGIRCLENYKREYDNVKKVYRDQPLHDWSSNGSDSFRYLSTIYGKDKVYISQQEENESIRSFIQHGEKRELDFGYGIPVEYDAIRNFIG